jgi:two-component SAPR family response regulator
MKLTIFGKRKEKHSNFKCLKIFQSSNQKVPKQVLQRRSNTKNQEEILFCKTEKYSRFPTMKTQYIKANNMMWTQDKSRYLEEQTSVLMIVIAKAEAEADQPKQVTYLFIIEL